MNLSLSEIAHHIGGKVIGNKDLKISYLSSLEDVVDNSLVFSDSEANFKKAEISVAAAIIVKEERSSSKPLIIVNHPFKAFIKLLSIFHPPKKELAGIHPTAVIEKNVTLGKNIFIGPYVTVGENTHIGDGCIIKSHVAIGEGVQIKENTILHPHTSLYDHTKIGKNVIIHSGCVIGGDGFGYLFADGEHLKVPHVGQVVIEDNVEIGANTCIDRATVGSTVIGEGTKIDNLVQVAHSVKLGKHNILCAFTGIAGSTVSGDNVICAANVGVSDHVHIEEGVILTARAGVPSKKRLLKGNIYLGNPARPREKAIEQELLVSRIPFIRKTLKNLGDKVNHLYEILNKDEAK